MKRKLPFSKRAYCDAMRRTRIIRIAALVLALPLAFITVSELGGGGVTTAQLTMCCSIAGAVLFMLFCDMVIFCFHRKQKWEMFQTLPVAKREWFWTGFVAEVTNLLIYAVISEAAVAIFALHRKEMRNYIRPVFFPHVQKVLLCMTIGIVFLAVISLIRELTHTSVAFFALLIGSVGGFYVSFALLPLVVRSFSGNIVSIYGSFAFRMRLLYRIMETLEFEGECLSIAYDWGALLFNLLAAAGMLFVGDRLADRSETEYIGAEYRNKRLFYVLMTVMNFLPLLFVFYCLVIGGEYTYSVFLVPVLMGLIIFLLCHLFRKIPDKKTVLCVGFSVILTGLLVGTAYFYGIYGKKLPERDRIVAVQIMGWQEGIICKEDGIDKVYEKLCAELEKPLKHSGPDDTMRVRVYTKNGRKEYYIPLNKTEGDDGNVVFCGYGNKARIVTPFSSQKEYDTFISLLPENETKEVPVYYVNVLGGMSRSTQTVTVAAGDYNAGAMLVNVNVLNGLDGDGFIACAFNLDTDLEAATYYNEKVFKPQRQKMIAYLRDNRDAEANNITIMISQSKTWYHISGFVGDGIVRAGLRAPGGRHVEISQEDGVRLYDILFGKEVELDMSAEKERIYVVIDTYGKNGLFQSQSYDFLVSADRVKELVEHFEKAYSEIKAEDKAQEEGEQ